MTARIDTAFQVIQSSAQPGGRTTVELAYNHLRLERQGNLCSAVTLEHRDQVALPFLRWVR